MPTTVITGRDVSFTIGGNNFDAQTTSAVLSCETIIETYQTLDGRAYKSVDKQWTFTLELLQDWGAASSLFEAMWADAESAPNTTLAVSFTAFYCLDELYHYESRWNPSARNGSHYGIPQGRSKYLANCRSYRYK